MAKVSHLISQMWLNIFIITFRTLSLIPPWWPTTQQNKIKEPKTNQSKLLMVLPFVHSRLHSLVQQVKWLMEKILLMSLWVNIELNVSSNNTNQKEKLIWQWSTFSFLFKNVLRMSRNWIKSTYNKRMILF